MPLNLSWAVFTPVLKIFGVVAVGMMFRRYSRLDVRPLTDLTMQVFVPSLAFSSLMAHKIELADLISMVGSSVLTIAGTGLLAVAAFRLFRISRRGPFIAIMFLNAATLPFPLVKDVYGEPGLFRGVLYYIATSALIFSLGLYMVSKTTDFKELLRVPVLPALALALALNFTGTRPPQPALDIIDMMGQAAIPLILFVFGHTLYSVRVTHIGITLLCSMLRIGGGLLMGILAIRLLGIEGLNRDIVLIYSIMPSAVVNVIISRKYEADPEIVASTVFLTTAISLLTIPLMLAYLGH
jgi:predicted permease